MKAQIALAAGIVVATTLPSLAQTTWDFGGNAGYGSSNGNTISVLSDGVKVTASAWSYTKGSSNNALESAKLGQWGPGLGVVNREEKNSSPWHQVDNFEQNDYILFVFDSLVDISSVRITPSPGPYDRDVTYWTGNIGTSNLDSVTYNGLAALGFDPEQNDNSSPSSSGRSVAISSPAGGVNAILFGARKNQTFTEKSEYIDAFKVRSVTATVVPEPSAALLSMLGALGFCVRRRR